MATSKKQSRVHTVAKGAQVKNTTPTKTIEQPAPAPAPTTPAPTATVALRGGLALSVIKLSGKNYRVGAPHNAGWWKQIQDGVAAGNGQANVADLVKAGVPAIFIGYVFRRGYLAEAKAETK